MGFTRLRVIDKDRIEARNLSGQPYSRAEVGAPKARALANLLYRAVQTRVEPQAIELTASNASQLLAGSVLVIDAFDNAPSRAIVSQTTRDAGLPCLHIGFSPDGLYGNGIWEPNYQIPQYIPGDPCDYPLTRPLALALTSLAARAITDYLRHGQTHHFELTWSDLKIHYHPQI
ncbi:ThiF family adenylyltransferase [Dictyobacter alpinus]